MELDRKYSMTNKSISSKFLKYLFIGFFGVTIIVTPFVFDVNSISDFFFNVVSDLNSENFFGLTLVLLVFILRSVSIIIPILPGTIFSAVAGFQFGFNKGLVIIFFADFISC